MLSRSEILEKLGEILESAGDAPEPGMKYSEKDRLATDLHLSSVGILFMVIAIEEAFDIQFEDVGVNDFETVGQVIDYIEEKMHA